MKILFFASNPEDVTPLNLDEEIRAIKTKIYATKFRDVLELISRWAVRPDDLLQELLENKPTIVHFSGHGTASGELILMDDSRKTKVVSPDALQALFSTLKDNIQVVVLNACYSKKQGIAIAKVIDFVVGMNASIGDQAAINFAASFYRAIGFGRSVKEAFDQGKVSIMLEGIPEANTPVLLHRPSIDPAMIYLVHKKQSKNPGNKIFNDTLTTNQTRINISELGNIEIAAHDQPSLKVKEKSSTKKDYADRYDQQIPEDIKWDDKIFGHFIDMRDQQKYKIVKIGNQIWMAENLKATKFNDGTLIPLIRSNTEWSRLTTPGFCWYDNDSNNKDFYGALYNGYAINSGKLSPIGWHVPSDDEWTTLFTYLGGRSIAMKKLVEANAPWYDMSIGIDLFTDATNESGFTARPAGARYNNGLFKHIGGKCYYWTSTDRSASTAWRRDLSTYGESHSVNKSFGYPIRCLKNS